MVRNRGGITHLEWIGRLDGNDYPVQGVELVLTNAYRRVDDRTYELIQKIDGEVVATRDHDSPDGRMITTVNASRTASATTIYERLSSRRMLRIRTVNRIPSSSPPYSTQTDPAAGSAKAAVEEPEAIELHELELHVDRVPSISPSRIRCPAWAAEGEARPASFCCCPW